MRNRALGKTGYSVSELGYGAWGLGGEMWLGSGDREGGDALKAAFDQGVTFFDTALAYGSGHSERLIGKVLKAELHDGRAVVATKVPPRNQQWPADGNKPVTDVFPPKHIASSTETSLKNLGIEALPVEHPRQARRRFAGRSGWDRLSVGARGRRAATARRPVGGGAYAALIRTNGPLW